MTRNELELKLMALAVVWGARYIPLPDEDWQDDIETVECSGCGEMGEPNYDGNKFFCGGSPRCCP